MNGHAVASISLIEMDPQLLPKALETLCSATDLLQTVGAIVSWASTLNVKGEVIKAGEVFFSSKAMEIILGKLIVEPNRLSNYSMRSALSNLLSLVLNLPPDSQDLTQRLVEEVDALAECVRQSRVPVVDGAAYSQFLSPGSQSVAVIASRLADALRKFRGEMRTAFSSTSSATEVGDLQKKIIAIDSALDAIKGSLLQILGSEDTSLSSSPELKVLLEAREARYEQFRLNLEALQTLKASSHLTATGAVLKFSHEKKQSATTPACIIAGPQADKQISTCLLAEIGETTTSLELKISKADAAQQYLNKLVADSNSRLAPIRDELQELNHKITSMEAQRAHHLRLVDEMDIELAIAHARKSALQDAHVDIQLQQSGEITGASSSNQLAQSIKAIQIDSSVKSVLKAINRVEHKFADLIEGLAANGCEDVSRGIAKLSADIPQRIQDATKAISAYATVEAECISFISGMPHVSISLVLFGMKMTS